MKEDWTYLPPLADQQHIAPTLDSIISKVDRLQANYDKISQECDTLKQAILRHNLNLNEAQTRFNKIDPKLRDDGWGIVPVCRRYTRTLL